MQRYKLITDYPGSNAPRFDIRQEEHRLYVQYPKEGCYAAGVWHDYAWSFNFGLQNTSGEILDIEVFVNCASAEDCPAQPFTLYGSQDPIKGFEALGPHGRSDWYTRYYFTVSIPAGETRYFSNTMPRDYDTFIGSLASKARLHGVGVRDVGQTVEERAIRAFEFGDPGKGKPTLLYTSGLHPAEGDSYGLEAIFDHLCSAEGAAWLQDFNVVLIPAANPDGFVHGINGANANGVNLYWNFEYRDRQRVSEAYWLWQYFHEVKPVLYVDFHAYVTQWHKRMGPYIKPAGLYATARVRAIVQDMNAFLIQLAGGKFQQGYMTYARTTLAYLLTRDLNTITYTKFHFHLKDGIPFVRRKAVEIFEGLAGILRKHDVRSPEPVLLHPAGSVQRSLHESLRFRYLVAREELKNPLRRVRALFR